MKTALVTGSAGFIGRHMVAALEQHGYAVEEMDSVREHIDVRKLPLYGNCTHYDLVVHCAALVDGRETIEHKAALIGAYNLQLDGALFEWALRARPGRIVYFSSSAMYPVKLQQGAYGGARLEEWHGSLHPEPDNTYGWVKLTGERLAAEVRKAGVPVTVVRPFSGYGSDQDDCYPFPAMIARAHRRDVPFEVWGDGQQVRDFIHVDDITAAILALVDAKADGPVNLGTGRATSMDDLARLAMDAAGYAAPIKHLAGKPAGVQYRVADPTLLKRFYEPRVSREDGVRRAMEALR